MDIFSDAMDVAFQTDSRGRTLFFPWGVISKGYVVPDADLERRIKHFYKSYYLIAMAGVIMCVVLLGWPVAILLGVVSIVWYAVQTRIYTRRCEPADVSVLQHMEDIARKYNLTALWGLFATCVLIVLLGGVMLLLGERAGGIVFMLVFGLIGGVYGTLLRLRK